MLKRKVGREEETRKLSEKAVMGGGGGGQACKAVRGEYMRFSEKAVKGNQARI